MKEEWLFPGVVVPVDVQTTAALVAEIKRLIDVVGGMALAQPEQCQCPNCKVTLHASDCAVHSGPAYPAGGCDCGAQQGPEFIQHVVEHPTDWSEWVCPNPKGYLMKCCDCGLVHEAEFGVVRYKSETEREACDMVDDPNLQAVFRMRRSEEWSPEDTAHRAGGMPMAQPEQEPVKMVAYNCTCGKTMKFESVHGVVAPQRTWVGLTDEEAFQICVDCGCLSEDWLTLLDAIEAKLKEKNTSWKP